MQPHSTAAAPALDAGRPITRIVLPSIDGMLHDRTTTLGVRLAEAWGTDLELVHVTSSIASVDPVLDHLAEQAQSVHPDIDVQATHLYGDDPAAAVADHVGSGALVIMATEHIDAWRIKDSVAERLLDRIGVPVLLIGPNVTVARIRERGLDGEVVLGVDGSAAAEAGIAPALALAKAVGHRLWLARIVPDPQPGDPFHPEISSRLQALAEEGSHEIATRWEVIQHNDPVDALETLARRRDAAVLVVSRRRRTNSDRPSMASTAAGLVAMAARPVLVVSAPKIPAVEAG